jgi:hypothetical protein
MTSLKLDKETINEIVDFCFEHEIPNIPGALQMYESFHNEKYEKFSNKHVADKEIWSDFKQVYQAYWDTKLKQELNRYKNGKV